MKVFDVDQGSPQWFACRAGIATASNFAAVMATVKSGEAAERRNYRARLVVESITGKSPDGYQNAAMRQGIEREPDARALYESRSGVWVDEVGFCRHDSLPAGASPDGMVGEDGLVEIKSPELATHLDYLLSDGMPAKYRPQVQGQLWITGREWCDFVSFNPDFPEKLRLGIWRIQRDDVYIQTLQAEVTRFMVEVAAELEKLRAKL